MNYASESPVARMATLSQLPERTFKRRFAQATGMAPLEYVHHVRLEEAKQLLESGEPPIEGIAVDVGYSDSSFFSRLFRRKVGMTPVQYRQRFGRLSRQLDGLAARSGAQPAAIVTKTGPEIRAPGSMPRSRNQPLGTSRT